jgi:hypothetical protein
VQANSTELPRCHVKCGFTDLELIMFLHVLICSARVLCLELNCR